MLCFLSDFMDRPLAFSLDYVNELQSYMIHIIIYNYFKLKSLIMYHATIIFYIQLLIETSLQIMNDQLYLNLSFIYNIQIFCISVLFHIISYIIFLDLIFIFSMACIMTFSILHVYLQKNNNIRCTYM